MSHSHQCDDMHSRAFSDRLIIIILTGYRAVNVECVLEGVMENCISVYRI